MNHVSFYRPEYPRPQFVRKSFLDLNGEWEFEFDDNNIGMEEKWFEKHDFSRRIVVPFSYQTEKSGINEQEAHEVLWYRKTFQHQGKSGERLLLHFEGVDFRADVWVNGSHVGSHEGAYSRFSFDITDYLRAGENEITLRAEDPYDSAQPRGKQRWGKKSIACFYIETSGIWKGVWCESVSKHRLERVDIQPLVDEESAAFSIELDGFEESLTLETCVSFGGQTIFEVQEALVRRRVEFRHTLISETGLFKLNHWSPCCPCIYEVVFRLKRGDELLDEVFSYFGMRKVEFEGKQFLNNHIPDYFRGVLVQGYWKQSHLTPPDALALEKDVELIKSMGFNGVRVHEKTEDERFYYFCDMAGVYTTCEMPSNYEYSEKGNEYLISEWPKIVRQFGNHPSLICWIAFNESWGVFQIAKNVRHQQLTLALRAITKALDAQNRPVISNDGWEHTESDIVTLHSYLDDEKLFYAAISQTEKYLRNEKTEKALPKNVFADGFSYCGQPLMITEYGGVAFVRDTEFGWGYGKSAADEEEFLDRIGKLTRAIEETGAFCGYCYTQFTDVQQEMNGLLTIDRQFKADQAKLKEIFSKEI